MQRLISFRNILMSIIRIMLKQISMHPMTQSSWHKIKLPGPLIWCLYLFLKGSQLFQIYFLNHSLFFCSSNYTYATYWKLLHKSWVSCSVFSYIFFSLHLILGRFCWHIQAWWYFPCSFYQEAHQKHSLFLLQYLWLLLFPFDFRVSVSLLSLSTCISPLKSLMY